MRPKLTRPEKGFISAAIGSTPISYDEKEDQMQRLLDALADMLEDILAGLLADMGFEQAVLEIVNNYFYNWYIIDGGGPSPKYKPGAGIDIFGSWIRVDCGDGLWFGSDAPDLEEAELHVKYGAGLNIEGGAGTGGYLQIDADLETGLQFTGGGAADDKDDKLQLNIGEGLWFDSDGAGVKDLNVKLDTEFDSTTGGSGPGLTFEASDPFGLRVAPKQFLHVT